ncbi:hypothetical protein NLG97_g1997 [Lecanicillium saksenae]|uniref:Uncharacterized protein n=1 Tax=Lecanicillium saksenae TaxID=468837 RepID=A0ACC1R423_9HYPO|nr:hypothetical protein NLG97_g1997 [Lecanicillium saksenae]
METAKFWAACLLLCFVAAQVPGTQSISAMKDYSALRPCARSCFWRTSFNTRTKDDLGSSLKCELTKAEFQSVTVAMNECYCRPDLQPYAYQSLSRCISRLCTPSDSDLSSAAGIYDSYCTANGYFRDDSEVVATPISGGNDPNRAGGGSGLPRKTGAAGESGSGSNACERRWLFGFAAAAVLFTHL